MTTTFEVIGATPLPRRATPTLAFAVRATESAEPFPRAIHTIALRIEILIDASHRSPGMIPPGPRVEQCDTGDPWPTVHRLPWRQVDTLVPSFCGSTTFLVSVTCGFDPDMAGGECFPWLGEGEVPLTFLFSGTVFYEAYDGRLRVEQLEYDTHAGFRLSARTWRELMRRHHPGGSWVRVSPGTFEQLRAHCRACGATSYDSAISRLLERQDHRSLRVRT